MLLPNQPIPSTAMLRKMIEERIKTDAELEAFCLDYFSQVHRRFGSGMERLQKENLLLQVAPPDELFAAILTAYPEIHESHPSSSDEHITARVFRLDLATWVKKWPTRVAVSLVLLAGGTAALWQWWSSNEQPGIAKPHHKKFIHWSLTTKPAGAQILQAHNGEFVAGTPWTQQRLADDGRAALILRYPGYSDKWIILDLNSDENKNVDLVPNRMLHVSGGPVAPFWIDETEVTEVAYEACVYEQKCIQNFTGWEHSRYSEWDAYPVNYVDYYQAAGYCAWAGKRLPTAAEWQYAYQGSDERRYPWGNTAPQYQPCWQRGEQAIVQGRCLAGSHPADKSPFGILDMAGNLKEWTARADCTKATQDCLDTAVAISRGGSWRSNTPAAVGATTHHEEPASARTDQLGFRCAKDAY